MYCLYGDKKKRQLLGHFLVSRAGPMSAKKREGESGAAFDCELIMLILC